MSDSLSSIGGDKELEKKLEAAADTDMSEEELKEQKVSYVYGSMKHDDGITKQQVKDFMKKSGGYSC